MELFAKFVCTNCQEDIPGIRIHCTECTDYESCLQCFAAGWPLKGKFCMVDNKTHKKTTLFQALKLANIEPVTVTSSWMPALCQFFAGKMAGRPRRNCIYWTQLSSLAMAIGRTLANILRPSHRKMPKRSISVSFSVAPLAG